MTLRATVRLMVLVPVVLTLVLGVTGLAGRLSVRAALTEMTTRTEPARVAADALATALVDQETGSRGYLLTGDPRFLGPYQDGLARAATAQAQLTALLVDDPAGRADLDAATAAASQWRLQAAQPQTAARAAGTPFDLEAATVSGKDLFDRFRATADVLRTHLADREADQLAAVAAAQSVADAIAIAGLVLALLVAAIAPVVIRRRLAEPVNLLQRRVRDVAGGQVELPIAVAAPAELSAIAADVDLMRRSLLERRAEAVEAQLELSLRETRDRLAGEVHDNTVQRLFALGLSLDAIVATEPRVRERLSPLVDELDEAMRELRALIFGLTRTSVTPATVRDAVFDLTRDSARALGFTPVLGVHGDLRAALDDEDAVDLLAVLREALSNVARHAHASSASVRLVADGSTVSLQVVDDGQGPPEGEEVAARGHGIASMAARATRRGGSAEFRRGPSGGSVLQWTIPALDVRAARSDARTGGPSLDGAGGPGTTGEADRRRPEPAPGQPEPGFGPSTTR